MKTCSNCGQSLPDDAIFCGHCGKRLSPQPEPAEQPLQPEQQPEQNTPPIQPEGEPEPSAKPLDSEEQQPQSEEQQPQPEEQPPVQEAQPPRQDPQPPQPDSFCPNCGERIQGDAVFCPNCGAHLDSPDPAKPGPAKPKKPILGIALGAAAVVVLCVIGAVALPGLFSSPEKEFVQIQQELFVDRVMDQLEETLDVYGTGQFSTDLTLSASVDTPEINRYLEDSSIGLKLDLNRDTLLAEGQLVLMGSPVLNAVGTYDKGQVGFSLPEVDDNYYVMDLSSMIYDFTGQEVDLSQLALPEISGKEWRSLLQSYLDTVYTVVTKDNVEVEKNKSVLLEELDRRFDGTVYTFSPSGEDVEAMFLKIADNLQKDETLRSMILDVVSPEALEAAFGEEVFGGYDLEEQLDEAILSLADTLEEQASDIGRAVEDSDFTWTLVTEKKEVRMIRLEADGQAVVYERDGSESGGLDEVLYVESYGESQVLLEHEYTKKGSVSQGSLVMTIPYESTVIMDYELDEEKRSALGTYYGTYELSMPDEGVNFSLEVREGDEGGVDHILSLYNIQDLSYYAPFDRLELTINATDKSTAQKPSGKTVDITDYSTRELEELFTEIGSVLQQDLIDNLEPLMYDLYYYF